MNKKSCTSVSGRPGRVLGMAEKNTCLRNDKVLDWTSTNHIKWFIGGKLNACYNATDL
jgi:hypothetical protein